MYKSLLSFSFEVRSCKCDTKKFDLPSILEEYVVCFVTYSLYTIKSFYVIFYFVTNHHFKIEPITIIRLQLYGINTFYFIINSEST